MKMAEIISAIMQATYKSDDLLPIKEVAGITFRDDKISIFFVDGNTEDYTINKEGDKTDFPDCFIKCPECRSFVRKFHNYCPNCGAKLDGSYSAYCS